MRRTYNLGWHQWCFPDRFWDSETAWRQWEPSSLQSRLESQTFWHLPDIVTCGFPHWTGQYTNNLLSLQITCLLTLMAIRYKHQLLYWTNLQSQCHITNTSITILTCTGEMLKCIMIDKRCFMSPVLRICRSSWVHVVSGVTWLNFNYDHYHDFKSPDYQMSSRICPWWPFIITTVSNVVYLTLRRWDNL